MSELAAEPQQQGEPPELSPALRQRGWSIRQSSEGDWYYVHTAPDGRVTSRFKSPDHGWPAAQLLGREQADQLFREAVAEAVEACADDTKGQACYICYGEGEGLVRRCACRGGNGFAHVSCLARGAKVLVAEAEERDLDDDAFDAKWRRWDTCGLCEQKYHGLVACALGWACWKTYVGRPETDRARQLAMSVLGNGLHEAKHYEYALSVQEAELAMWRRLGDSESEMLIVQHNLASTYSSLGRKEEAMRLKRDVYSGRLKLQGEEHRQTLLAANNYSTSLLDLHCYATARSLMSKTIPVAQRVLGESHNLTLRMKWNYARALYKDDAATLDDLREAVTRLEDAERTARRVFGGAHPITKGIGFHLREARAALCACEAPDDETVDGSAQEDDNAESPTPVAASMPAEATVAPRPPPPLPRPLPRRVTSILCCW